MGLKLKFCFGAGCLLTGTAQQLPHSCPTPTSGRTPTRATWLFPVNDKFEIKIIRKSKQFMYLDQVRKGGERTTTTKKLVKEKPVNLTASQTMSLPSSLLEFKQKRGQIKKIWKNCSGAIWTTSFSLKHTVLNFSYQATKNLLLVQTFPIPTSTFIMQKVKLFLHILRLFLGALELILRAAASVKKKLSSMQTTFGTVFTKTFKYQKQLQPGILLFPYIWQCPHPRLKPHLDGNFTTETFIHTDIYSYWQQLLVKQKT